MSLMREPTVKPQGARRARLRWALALLLRIVAVVLTVQTSGLAHVAADLASAACGETAEHEDCTREGDDDRCPPGCPNCHCSHGGVNVMPAFGVALNVPDPPDGSSWSRPDATARPPAPARTSLYRPPKATPAALG
jgi:hypothetical protein